MANPISLSSLVTDPILLERVQMLLDRPVRQGLVLYWMSRDQRAEDNWALTLALQAGASLGQPVLVVFFLRSSFCEASLGDRHYRFMLTGLQETRDRLAQAGIDFILMNGPARELLPRLADSLQAGLVVTDFNPLREIRDEQYAVADNCAKAGIHCPIASVDAHNIVPWHQVSQKRKFAARTIRPKINRLTGRYLVSCPALLPHPFPLSDEWRQRSRRFAMSEWPFTGLPDPILPISGAHAAQAQLDQFIVERRSDRTVALRPDCGLSENADYPDQVRFSIR